jgi:hypothetical protein
MLALVRIFVGVMLVMLGCGSKSEPNPEPPPPPPEQKSLVDRAKSFGDDVVDKAFATGKELKDSVDGNLKLAKLDYDLAVDTDDEDDDTYEARVSELKQIEVGSYRVGYERDSKHPRGDDYKWQFRITWRVPATRRSIRLSIFTNHDLSQADLVDALRGIIPVAEKLVL